MNQNNPIESIERLRLERELYWRLLELGHTKDVTAFLQEGLSLICEVTAAEKGYLVLYSPERPDEPLFWAERGFSLPELPLVQRKLSRGIISAALATGETILLTSALEDPRFQRNQSVTEHEIKEVLCAPIGDPPPLGVLYLQGCKTGPFTEADRRCAEAFARQTAPMVDRLLAQGRETNQDPTLAWRQRLKLERLVGKSRALSELFRQIESAARFEMTVMLVGASGTGKDEVARTLHDNSSRSSKPFLKVSCAELTEAFFEDPASETRGSPHLSEVQGGTLLFDDLEELSLPIQRKLLRLLQSKEEESKPSADIRILTSTNTDLRKAVEQKIFREDLFYHLSALQLPLPMLAERREDIVPLAQFFGERVCRRHRLPSMVISNAALRALEMLEWPGNVRQLLHFIEAATLRASVESASKIEHHHLFPQEASQEKTISAFLTFQEATRRFQKQFLEDLLRVVDWNIPEAARRLDLARTHVYHLIQGFSLQHPKKKRE